MSLSDSIQKHLVQRGEEGKKPRFWSEIEVQISNLPTSTLEGLPVSTSLQFSEGVLKLQVGLSSDEPARILDQCVQLMNVQEVCQFRVKDSSGAWAALQIALVNIFTEVARVPFWEPQQLLQASNTLRELGVSLYKEKRIADSFHAFSQAVKLVIPIEVKLNKELSGESGVSSREKIALRNECRARIASLYCNLAACHLEKGNHENVLYLCDQVLERSPEDVKAIYRKSSSLIGNPDLCFFANADLYAIYLFRSKEIC